VIPQDSSSQTGFVLILPLDPARVETTSSLVLASVPAGEASVPNRLAQRRLRVSEVRVFRLARAFWLTPRSAPSKLRRVRASSVALGGPSRRPNSGRSFQVPFLPSKALELSGDFSSARGAWKNKSATERSISGQLERAARPAAATYDHRIGLRLDFLTRPVLRSRLHTKRKRRLHIKNPLGSSKRPSRTSYQKPAERKKRGQIRLHTKSPSDLKRGAKSDFIPKPVCRCISRRPDGRALPPARPSSYGRGSGRGFRPSSPPGNLRGCGGEESARVASAGQPVVPRRVSPEGTATGHAAQLVRRRADAGRRGWRRR
jgi:hypothetical protein